MWFGAQYRLIFHCTRIRIGLRDYLNGAFNRFATEALGIAQGTHGFVKKSSPKFAVNLL
jgi:hypothetical protein